MFKNCLDAENEFENCWRNPTYTAIQLDDVDVNQALLHYTANKPVHFTIVAYIEKDLGISIKKK